jgi:hypothetical protein
MSFCLFHFARASRASHPAQRHQCCFKWHLLSLVTSAARSRPTGADYVVGDIYKRTCQTSCLSTTCRSLNGRKMSFCLFHFARASRASHPAQRHQCCFKWHLLFLVTSAARSRPTGQIRLWVTLRSNRHGLSFNTPKIFLTHSYQKHQNQLHLKGEIRSFVQEIVAF